MDTIIKTPIEKFPIKFDFSSDMVVSETIASSVLTCVDASTGENRTVDIAYAVGPPEILARTKVIASKVDASPEVIVVLQEGVEGEEHLVQCVILTTLGNTFQRDLLLMVQTIIDDSFGKQPSDALLYDIDFAGRLETGDPLTSASAVAIKESDGSDVSGSVIVACSSVTPLIGTRVRAGVDGKTYLLRNRAVSLAGYVYEKNIRMNVQEL